MRCHVTGTGSLSDGEAVESVVVLAFSCLDAERGDLLEVGPLERRSHRLVGFRVLVTIVPSTFEPDRSKGGIPRQQFPVTSS